MIRSAEKTAYFARERIPVTGDPTQPEGCIEQLGRDGLMLRRAEFRAKTPGETVEILHLTDMHLSALNARDLAEKNPVVESSHQHRIWCRDGESLPNAERAMALSAFADQTVVTGDTLDYLTWGTLDLVQRCIWDVDPEALVALGGHDTVRRMQGEVDDPTSLDSRFVILQRAWKHNIFYTSKVLKGRVMVIQLDNGNGGYDEFQFRKLSADLAFARENALIVLIFQHEPLCTRNPSEVYVEPIRTNDGSGKRNFFDNFLGSDAMPDPSGVYDAIRGGADVIKGIFCGHRHSDFYTELRAFDRGSPAVIPQYVLTGCPYDNGHALWITVR